MTTFDRNFKDPAFVERYTHIGPPAFMPGHSGVLQMAGVLIAERTPADGRVLVVGAGGGLDTRALAESHPGWHFVGVDPSMNMLELARHVLGPTFSERVELIEGVVDDASLGPFDAATCILVLDLIPDNGAKLKALSEVRRRLRPGAPFILVDQCLDRSAVDFELRLDRYEAYARASGVDAQTTASAREQLRTNPALVPASRNEQLLSQAGFSGVEVFYVGMAWRGWVAYA
jgi:tRNA (cmo5U34)-methyltransferase